MKLAGLFIFALSCTFDFAFLCAFVINDMDWPPGGRHPRATTVRRREHENRGTGHHEQHRTRDHRHPPIPMETRGRRGGWSDGSTEENRGFVFVLVRHYFGCLLFVLCM